jgi:hypothetical protein
MEKCGNLCGVFGLRACSACRGDYEDPDRTAGEEFEELLEEHEEECWDHGPEDQRGDELGK